MKHFLGANGRAAICFISLLTLTFPAPEIRADNPPVRRPFPVILDTDIGDDIDDTWALALLLQSPELDLKLAVGDYGKAQYRARLLAKFLSRAGRSDVPVGVGLDIAPSGDGRQAAWVKDYRLKSYPGKIRPDGVQALVDTIMNSPQPVTLICIGPVPNIAAALKREPRIAQHARFVGMDGSVRLGYDGAKRPCAEWNVKADPKALQAVFAAQWDITITPLDTCGLVRLTGERYRRVCDHPSRCAADVIPNYRLWLAANPASPANAADNYSSTLFDTVAVYLAQREDLCVMEKLHLRVTDGGMTVIDPQGREISVATQWKDIGAYEDFLVEHLGATAVESYSNHPLGAASAAIIAAPDSVRAWRTVGSLHPDSPNREPHDWYRKSGKGLLVTNALTAQLSKVLLDRKTYPPPLPAGVFTSGKNCMPMPGVVLAFTKGKSTLELYVCFECNIMTLYIPGNEKDPHPETGGEVDFDPGHNNLLRVVKKIFLKDQQIQSLRNREG